MNYKYTILTMFSLLLMAGTTFAKGGKSTLDINLGPHTSLTQNASAFFGYDKGPRVGLGYTATVGYSRVSRSGLVVSTGAGYYSFRQSVDTEPLHMFLGKNDLSYRVSYMHAVLRLGYQFAIPGTKLHVTPMLGTRFLFYLPQNNLYGTDWIDVNLSLYQSNDIMAARYRCAITDQRFWDFMFQTAIRTSYSISERIQATATIFWDMGFKPLRADGFMAEELYYRNRDYYYYTTAVNKGDAIGLLLGVSYLLSK